MNMAVYRPAMFVLGRAMTRIFPNVETSIGMAMCSPRSSNLEDEIATAIDAKNANR